MFGGSDLPEFCFGTSFSPVSPGLAVSHSACLHRSRWTGVRGAGDWSLRHGGLLCMSFLCGGCRWTGVRGVGDWSLHHGGLLRRSLLCGGCRQTGGRFARASYRPFSSAIGVLTGFTGLQLRPLGEALPNQVRDLLNLASVCQQPVIVAVFLYPPGEVLEFMQVYAGHRVELPSDQMAYSLVGTPL